MSIAAPALMRTDRLLLRPWCGADAVLLAPVLAANVAHLADWIPRDVSAPAPVDALAERLDGYAADLAAGRSWRFGIFGPDESAVYGEASLFCRSREGRVAFGYGDRAEIGYWLRQDATGRGYATEAARALIELAAARNDLGRIEIRCDPANAASAAVPARLGFRLDDAEPAPAGMVWVLACSDVERALLPRMAQ